MNELALFAGAGGGTLGGKLLGWNTVCAVEIEKYPREVLLQRQRDGILPRFPIWNDITTFDGKPWKGRIDIISGGFPCQDISAAGRGEGIEGERSGLWKEMARVVSEVRPQFVFVENSPMLTSRGLGAVLGDLATLGYDARWCVLGANDAGAPHQRKRIWILAYADQIGRDGRTREFRQIGRGESENGCIQWWDEDPADMGNTRLSEPPTAYKSEKASSREGGRNETRRESTPSSIWPTQSQLDRVARGMAHRVDRLKAIGNGQVPAVAAIAFIILSEGLI